MDAEREVLDVLARNAREDIDDIAAQTGFDAAAVAEAIDALEADNVVHGYQAVVDWDRVDEGKIRALVEINVELDRETGYEQVADRIAKFPAVDALHLVSGDYDFAVEVLGETMQDVSRFISEQVAPMPEVRSDGDPLHHGDLQGRRDTVRGRRRRRPPLRLAMRLSDRARDLPESGIRKFFELAEARDDVISLGVGRARLLRAVGRPHRRDRSTRSNAGRPPTPRTGWPPRERIAVHHERYDQTYAPTDEILVTTGASEAVDLAFRALVDPGDTVAVHEPTYISYGPGIELAGGEQLTVPTRAEDDFALTRESLEASGAADADLLVLCYPNNPTGATMTEEEYAEVAAFCRDNDLRVIADEIYSALTYGTEHTSIATQPGMRERTVVVNGFSKAYAMTGLRLGYALGPTDAIDAMNRIHQYTMLSAPTTPQYAACEALDRCDDEVAEMVNEYNRRRRLVVSRFNEMGLDTFEPGGAFYAFPDCGGDDDGLRRGAVGGGRRRRPRFRLR